MKHRLTYKFILLQLIIVSAVTNAQDLSSEQVRRNLQQFIRANPWEEVFLHIDRNMYVSGEDLWFCAYVTDRETGSTTNRSSIIYAELLNQMNIPVMQKRFKVTEGTGEGMFTLPDTLGSGTYTIRAYTNWMKNFLPGNCFSQDIQIFNPFSTALYKKKLSWSGPGEAGKMSFFPEGGTLVNGVSNRVVARVQTIDNESLLYTVNDNSGDSLAVFEVDKHGFGAFNITPVKGRTYTVIGNLRSFPLAGARDVGFSVAAEHSKDGSIKLRLTAPGANAEILRKEYYFLILSGAQVAYLADLYIDDPETVITIPPSRIPAGVSTFMILDRKGKPVCRRSIYSGNRKHILSSVTGDTATGRRSKVTLSINPYDDYSGQVNKISIAVTLRGLTGSFESLSDYLVFGTEFGQVPWRSANQSLSEADPVLIDNFLIASESSWIKWDLLNAGSRPEPAYGFESGQHSFPVIVKYREGASSDSSEFLFMSMKGKVADFRYARGDKNGRYLFMLPADNLLRSLVLQPENATSDMILEIEPSFSRSNFGTRTISTPPPEELMDEFGPLSFNYQAARIYGLSFLEPPSEAVPDDLKKRRFYGIPEMEIRLDDYIKLPVMQEVFFELVPGVVLRSRRGGFEMRIINPLTGLFYEEQPLVMIDGLIINDLTVIVNLDPEAVEKIEVVKTPYLVGDLILKGIVNIITRTGNFSGVTTPEFAAEIPYRVTEVLPRYKKTVYSEQLTKDSRKPDLRNTIHWETYSGAQVKEKFETGFWTPDTPGDYVIDIQGVTVGGDVFSLSKTVTVK